MKNLLGVFVTFGFSLMAAGFEVHVPREPVTVIHGHYAVLQCSFTPSAMSTEGIVITWQRDDTNEVVHSYYYNKEQLSKQSHRYTGRASIFPEEIKRGNASLKLEGVRPEDSGKYMCFVSTKQADANGIISVKFAAYYKEPVLVIELGTNATLFRFESQGFPQAVVSWFDEQHKDISFQANTFFEKNADGLYSVHSTLEIGESSADSLNFTFRIRNDALEQSLSRIFVFASEVKTETKQKTESPVARNRWIVALILLLIEFTVILFLVKALLSKHRTLLEHEKRHQNKQIFSPLTASYNKSFLLPNVL
ncbi:CD276 antigen [Callorhinchus milii]|uniref:CD276 antigen n=1 Tax=Callorhinchus milii TaxID=7868 RepID=V9L2M8_CALMI|nr:CD276 antigen [Callorhinchus milii]|eukprot:gi/632986669/ref/XP_007910366.1/ PREDICTED: CD276 antigen-like [Callorhinchus milii]